MHELIKADFHLHTYHSDNQDRMTPQEYVAQGRGLGYGVLGFCDHHHNLTQAAWRTLQDEVGALAGEGLLLTTGYEATFVVGHLCVLNKAAFDGESVADCRRELWSPANTRILAHPDNNACAWLLPLPVGVQGVEVINGGQDLYSYRASSPCNGLTSFARYLLLNHRVAAVAQSDCHERAIFGRVWTGLLLPTDTPLTWDAVQTALHQAHTFACMGDLPLRVWTAGGAIMGDLLADTGDYDLLWDVAPGSEVTVYVADQPVAFFGSSDQATGRYRIQGNGPHWLLVKRGVAWAVSSPVWVRNQPNRAESGRARLAAHHSVQHAADGLRRRLDWLQTLQASWSRSALPVADYLGWLDAQLPEQWADHDWAWEAARDAVTIGHARLSAANQIAASLLADVIRSAEVQPQASRAAPRVVIAAASSGAPRGLIQFTVDVPRDWTAIQITDHAGTLLSHAAQTIDGQRDPINSPRTRVQVEEIYVWLAHGEMHEYVLDAVDIRRVGDTLTIQIDLYPQELGREPHPDPAAADTLRGLVMEPEVAHIYVHLRMPRRFAVVMPLEPLGDAERRSLTVLEAAAGAAQARYFPSKVAPDLLRHDPAESAVVVQVG